MAKKKGKKHNVLVARLKGAPRGVVRRSTRTFRDLLAPSRFPNVHSRSGPKEHLPAYRGFEPNVSDGVRVLVPKEDHPGLLLLPSFDPPGIVMGRSPAAGFTGGKLHGWSITDDHDQRVERLKQSGATVLKREINPWMFGRMLAKVAHGTVVAYYGQDAFRPLLSDTILKGKDVAYYVGCASDRIEPPVPMKIWLRVEVREIGGKKYVVVFMRLFAYVGATVNGEEFGTPTYSVVVGEFIPWWARLGRYIGSFRHSSDRTLSLAL